MIIWMKNENDCFLSMIIASALPNFTFWAYICRSIFRKGTLTRDSRLWDFYINVP
jgi:hypothetical protein